MLREESNPEGNHVETIDEIRARLNPKGSTY